MKQHLLQVSLIFLLCGFSLFGCCGDKPPKCIESATVDKILELRYRYAVIQLSNGETIIVNQPTLKPGDVFCITYDNGYSERSYADNVLPHEGSDTHSGIKNVQETRVFATSENVDGLINYLQKVKEELSKMRKA